MNTGRRPPVWLAVVDEHRRGAAHRGLGPRARHGAGQDVVPQGVHQVLGGLVLGPVRGHDRETAASPASLTAGGSTAATPSVACTSAAMRSTVVARRPGQPPPAPARSTATSRGPLAPGPKLSLIWS